MQNESYGLKLGCCQGWFPLDTLKGRIFSCLFQLLEPSIPWLVTPSCITPIVTSLTTALNLLAALL